MVDFSSEETLSKVKSSRFVKIMSRPSTHSGPTKKEYRVTLVQFYGPLLDSSILLKCYGPAGREGKTIIERLSDVGKYEAAIDLKRRSKAGHAYCFSAETVKKLFVGQSVPDTIETLAHLKITETGVSSVFKEINAFLNPTSSEIEEVRSAGVVAISAPTFERKVSSSWGSFS